MKTPFAITFHFVPVHSVVVVVYFPVFGSQPRIVYHGTTDSCSQKERKNMVRIKPPSPSANLLARSPSLVVRRIREEANPNPMKLRKFGYHDGH